MQIRYKAHLLVIPAKLSTVSANIYKLDKELKFSVLRIC